MYSKFKIEKPSHVLHKRGPKHFEAERSARIVSLPLLEAYDERIRLMGAEINKLRREKVMERAIIHSQSTEIAEARAEAFQLRQEIQLLRDEVARSRLPVDPVKHTAKFNVSRKSYWEVEKAARSLKRKKITELFRNAAEKLPSEFNPIEIKFEVSGREVVIPLSNVESDREEDGGYTCEVVQRILAAKDEGLISDKAFHELRMALPEKVRAHVPPLSAVQYKEPASPDSSEDEEVAESQIGSINVYNREEELEG